MSDYLRHKVVGSVIVRKAVAITPDDDTVLEQPVISLSCTTDGLAYVDFLHGESNVPIQLIAGYWNPVCVIKVRATSTTALGIVGQLA